ncbi:citrate (Si)-synthase [Rickettsiales bacterium LUAb2]
MDKIKTKFAELAIPYANKIKQLVKENADLAVSEVTLGQLYGGMRGVMSLVTETSLLDPIKGIAFRGNSIDKIYENITSTNTVGNEPLPEVMFALFLNGEFPNKDEVELISKTWGKKCCDLPSYVYDLINKMPKNTHPMVQFSTIISALQNESLFAKAYHDQTHKNKLWEYAYEDAINIISFLPRLVSYIYNHNYNNDKHIDPDNSLDWAGNLAHMLGDKDNSKTSQFKEFLRLYMSLHSDHEGGNASAFTCHVVGSTLANPYAAYSASMQSLSGPLHGLACQSVLEWLQDMLKHFGNPNQLTKEQITDYINHSLNHGLVVPGYGHAVLRNTDPRFLAQMNFAKKYNIQSTLIDTVWDVYSVAPEILGKTGKIKNPYPNVDAHSGAILDYFGLKNTEFYTVLFGMSRSIGILTSLVWDRVFMHPIHRPKSVTSEWVKTNIIK